RGCFRCDPWFGSMSVRLPNGRVENFRSKTEEITTTKKNARQFNRFFFSGAIECEVNKQGRVNIPKTLRTYSEIEKECIIIGVSERIEIWSKDIWDTYFTESEASFAEIAEDLLDFDI